CFLRIPETRAGGRSGHPDTQLLQHIPISSLHLGSMIHRPRSERRADQLSFLAKLYLLVTGSSARSPRGPPPAHTRPSFAEWFMRTLTSCHDPSDWPYKRFAYLQPGLLPVDGPLDHDLRVCDVSGMV